MGSEGTVSGDYLATCAGRFVCDEKRLRRRGRGFAELYFAGNPGGAFPGEPMGVEAIAESAIGVGAYQFQGDRISRWEHQAARGELVEKLA